MSPRHSTRRVAATSSSRPSRSWSNDTVKAQPSSRQTPSKTKDPVDARLVGGKLTVGSEVGRLVGSYVGDGVTAVVGSSVAVGTGDGLLDGTADGSGVDVGGAVPAHPSVVATKRHSKVSVKRARKAKSVKSASVQMLSIFAFPTRSTSSTPSRSSARTSMPAAHVSKVSLQSPPLRDVHTAGERLSTKRSADSKPLPVSPFHSTASVAATSSSRASANRKDAATVQPVEKHTSSAWTESVGPGLVGRAVGSGVAVGEAVPKHPLGVARNVHSYVNVNRPRSA
mmetsp:Transcript_11473/g.37700  ORF Transcript_11473/g.37700 Transcript_11473/m.37700 type:complete len:283 (-) Transcript_11473:261-1109(-)